MQAQPALIRGEAPEKETSPFVSCDLEQTVDVAVSINALAGITGSASGGLSIALGALGQTFVERGLAAGLSMETMNRVAAIACSGLDALPHNGAVITLLTICGLTHKKSYGDIFAVSAGGTLLANVLVVAVPSIFPGF